MTTSFLILFFIIVCCLIIESFFSGSEIAFISTNKPKIFRAAKEKDPVALRIKNLLSRPESLFSTTVLGTTLAMSFCTTYTAIFIIQNFGESYEWINSVLLTPIILVFGEFVPKMYARSNPDLIAGRVSRMLGVASVILSPLTKLMSLYAQTLKLILGENPNKSFFLSREEIKAALPASKGSDVTQSERILVERIFEFKKTTAKEMFHPLIEVVGIEQERSISDAIRFMGDSGHSRLPVFQERIDRIVGIIQGFDCLNVKNVNRPVKEIMTEPFFIPESKPVDELLLELRKKPMAIAVNEYGGAEGIITMEDVVEEIVGDIEDEYDEPPKLYYRIGENSYIVNARMEIDAIRQALNINLPKNDEDYQTLAGYLLTKLQKIPKKWDSVTIEGVEYIIQSATDRAIEEVYVIIHKEAKKLE